MKTTGFVLKIMAVFLLIVGSEMIFLGITTSQERTYKSENISNIDISVVNDYDVIYFEELDILERYAFQTKRVETDSEGTQTGTYYYVYDGSQRMDNNKLDKEYYLVKFCDKSGKEYITSLCVQAGMTYSPSLTSGKTSACLAPYVSQATSSKQKAELLQLKNTAIGKYATEKQIAQASFSLEYKGTSIGQYQKNEEKYATRQRFVYILLGAVLILISIFQLCKKVENEKNGNGTTEQTQSHSKEPVSYGVWICQTCGTKNSTQYSQCKKCGKYKGM